MEDTIFILGKDGELVEMNESPYNSEDLLQRLLMDYPKLLAGNQINSLQPREWLLISREIGIPDTENGSNRWSLDHLFIDQDAVPTLVEVKRSTDTRIRREVIGQILDYAANAALFWSIDELIALFEKSCALNGDDPNITLENFLEGVDDASQFWEEVAINLKAGKIRLLIVADVIPKELKRIIEFLNGQMSPAEILGVEIKQYTGQDLKTLVPRVIGQTTQADVVKRKNRGERLEVDEDLFFEVFLEYSGREKTAIAQNVLDWARDQCDYFWFGGSGLEHGIGHSCTPVTRKKFDGKLWELLPFKIWSEGSIEINFQYYKNRPPFDQDSYKLQLMDKLNTIEGVTITPDKINKRPNFDIGLLRKESEFKKFTDAFAWYYAQYKK